MGKRLCDQVSFHTVELYKTKLVFYLKSGFSGASSFPKYTLGDADLGYSFKARGRTRRLVTLVSQGL